MSDSALRQNVIDELASEPGLGAAGIGVAVERGVVTLSGYVSSYSQRVAAERAAWRVNGVKAIARWIEVALEAGPPIADEEIARRAVSVLAWDRVVPTGAIEVRVASGWVTLSGTVSLTSQRSGAEYEVRKLPGVAGVTNTIDVLPRLDASPVRQRIASAARPVGEHPIRSS